VWGVVVAIPYIFVVNEERRWYNQRNNQNLRGYENGV